MQTPIAGVVCHLFYLVKKNGTNEMNVLCTTIGMLNEM